MDCSPHKLQFLLPVADFKDNQGHFIGCELDSKLFCIARYLFDREQNTGTYKQELNTDIKWLQVHH